MGNKGDKIVVQIGKYVQIPIFGDDTSQILKRVREELASSGLLLSLSVVERYGLRIIANIDEFIPIVSLSLELGKIKPNKLTPQKVRHKRPKEGVSNRDKGEGWGDGPEDLYEKEKTDD